MTEQKSYGQIAFETIRGTAGSIHIDWEQAPDQHHWWEAGAEAVIAAYKEREAAPSGTQPTPGKEILLDNHRQLLVSLLEARRSKLARSLSEVDDTMQLLWRDT